MQVAGDTDNGESVKAGVDVELLIMRKRLVADRRIVAADGISEPVELCRRVGRNVAGLVVGQPKETDVVHDHVAVGGQEVHGRDELQGGAEVGESQLGAGSDVVDDLQQRGALRAGRCSQACLEVPVGAKGGGDQPAGRRHQPAASVAVQRRGRQVSRCQGGGQAEDTVGDHADCYSGAVNSQRCAKVVEAQYRVALGQRGTDVGEAIVRGRYDRDVLELHELR